MPRSSRPTRPSRPRPTARPDCMSPTTAGPADAGPAGPASYPAVDGLVDRLVDGLFVGMISGTSADGIDAALVRFESSGDCELLLGSTFAWDPALRSRLVEIGRAHV